MFKTKARRRSTYSFQTNVKITALLVQHSFPNPDLINDKVSHFHWKRVSLIMGRLILGKRKTNVRIYSSPIPINHSLTRVLFPRLSIKTENIATPSSLPQGIYCKNSSIFFLLHQEESGGSLFQWKDKTENIATSSSLSHRITIFFLLHQEESLEMTNETIFVFKKAKFVFQATLTPWSCNDVVNCWKFETMSGNVFLLLIAAGYSSHKLSKCLH